MRKVPPLVLKESYYAAIEREVDTFFKELIFAPLMAEIREVLKRAELTNADSPLVQALRDGMVWYREGHFYGDFNSKITRDLRQYGAKWNVKSGTYSLATELLPAELRVAQAQAEKRFDALQRNMINVLDRINVDTINTERITKSYEKTIDSMERDWQKNIQGISIAPTFTPAQRDMIAKDWAQNLDKYIKNWAAEDIIKLREDIFKNTMLEGKRSSSLVETIQKNYGVSQRKAKFLARQETSLLLSKYTESRSKDIGGEKYMWLGSNDKRERQDHKDLNNKVFYWNDPPITNKKTGARNNPGEDYNCFPASSRVYLLGGIEKAFRRWYCGKLTTIILETGKSICATPNHPVLTKRGWCAISALNNGDEVFHIPDNIRKTFKPDGNKGIATIGEIFEACRESGFSKSFMGQRENFHGDGAAYDVNVIDTASNLSFNGKSSFFKSIRNLYFTVTDFFGFCFGGFFKHFHSLFFGNLSRSLIGFFHNSLSLFKGHARHTQDISFGLSSDANVVFKQSSSDNSTFNACSFGDGKFAFSSKISLDDRLDVNLQSIMGLDLVRVVKRKDGFFIGHVYNLQTDLGYYATEDVIVSNCRCVAVTIIE